MSDPTEIVLTGSFAAASGIAVVGVLVRGLMRRNRGDLVLVEPVRENGLPADEASRVTAYPPELPVGKVRVGVYRGLDLLGVAFVFLVFGGLMLESFRISTEMTPVLSPAVLLVNIGFQFFLAGIVVVLMVWRTSLVSWLGLRWPAWPWVLLIAPGTVVAMWVVFGGLQVSGYMKWVESLGVETVQDTVKLLQESKDPLVLGLMAFAAVVAAPLCEELVFRGYLYPVLKRYAGVWPAVVCSALVFACAHGSLAALLPLFIFGGVLVLIYEKTGSLWAPIAVHACFNGATVATQFLVRYYEIPLEGIQ